jgi:hypothetical protein
MQGFDPVLVGVSRGGGQYTAYFVSKNGLQRFAGVILCYA